MGCFDIHMICRNRSMEAVVLLTLVLMLYFLQTDDEKEMVSRTVYCTNIDKKVCKPSSLVGCVCVCVFANLDSDYARCLSSDSEFTILFNSASTIS